MIRKRDHESELYPFAPVRSAPQHHGMKAGLLGDYIDLPKTETAPSVPPKPAEESSIS
jgi:hypothetical protein